MRFILWTMILLVCYTASAEEGSKEVKNMTLEELMQVQIRVSTSSPSERIDKPSVVSIIDRDLIKNYHFESVAEAVRIVAGVEINQTNLDRNVEAFRGILQNFYSNKVLMMINNIPTWNTLYGNHTLDRVDINDVERIEILKGPASVLYGTNAYSGVINIITKSDDEDKLRGNIKLGYPGINSAHVSYSATFGDFKLAFSGSHNSEYRNPYLMNFDPESVQDITGGIYTFDSVAYFQEKFNTSTANISMSIDEHSFFANIFQNEFTYPGMNISYPSSANSHFRDRGILAGYNLQSLSLNDYLKLNGQLYIDHFVRDHPDNYPKTRAITLHGTRLGGKAGANIKLNNYFNLELGADFISGLNYDHKTVFIPTDTTVFLNMKNEKDITEYSVFGQADVKYGIFSMLIGTRYTINDVFNSNLSSRATAGFKLSDNHVIKLIYAEAFRTPNMLELYINHPTVVGNPNLDPETSNSYEFTFLSVLENFMFQGTAYYSNYRDIILRERPDMTKPANYKNVGKFTGYGAELEVRYVNSEILNGYLNYNYLAGEKTPEAFNNYRFVPKHTISVGLDKSFGDFNVAANSYIYSKTHGLKEDIPAQYTLNLHCSYHHHLKNNLGITHSISITNINNSDMLIPEYIRRIRTVNELQTTGFGTRLIYSVSLEL